MTTHDTATIDVYVVKDADGTFRGVTTGCHETVRKAWADRGSLAFDGDTAILSGPPITSKSRPSFSAVVRALPPLDAITAFRNGVASQRAELAATPSKPMGRYVKDVAELEAHARSVVEANPAAATRYRKGKTGVIGHLIAQVMERTNGGADPPLTKAAFERVLAEPTKTKNEGK